MSTEPSLDEQIEFAQYLRDNQQKHVDAGFAGGDNLPRLAKFSAILASLHRLRAVSGEPANALELWHKYAKSGVLGYAVGYDEFCAAIAALGQSRERGEVCDVVGCLEPAERLMYLDGVRARLCIGHEKRKAAELPAAAPVAEEMDAWVPVSERLPEHAGRYLVQTDGRAPILGSREMRDPTPYHTVMYYEPEHKEWMGFCFGDLTHWQPLPAIAAAGEGA